MGDFGQRLIGINQGFNALEKKRRDREDRDLERRRQKIGIESQQAGIRTNRAQRGLSDYRLGREKIEAGRQDKEYAAGAETRELARKEAARQLRESMDTATKKDVALAVRAGLNGDMEGMSKMLNNVPGYEHKTGSLRIEGQEFTWTEEDGSTQSADIATIAMAVDAKFRMSPKTGKGEWYTAAERAGIAEEGKAERQSKRKIAEAKAKEKDKKPTWKWAKVGQDEAGLDKYGFVNEKTGEIKGDESAPGEPKIAEFEARSIAESIADNKAGWLSLDSSDFEKWGGREAFIHDVTQRLMAGESAESIKNDIEGKPKVRKAKSSPGARQKDPLGLR